MANSLQLTKDKPRVTDGRMSTDDGKEQVDVHSKWADYIYGGRGSALPLCLKISSVRF
ncbi:MAG: hypothetical protein GY820_37130 [Gammaproteobacteria bacterium]|nr:hypothetical protein [Gammaproteobacteria bacterium]